MNKLSREEVMHVANLAKLELTDEEIEKYSYQLKQILDEIEKINEVDSSTDDILISPVEHLCDFKDKDYTDDVSKKLLENAPTKYDSYIEVRGVFND